MSPLLAQDYPYTAAYPHLSLAVALLQHPAALRVLISHSEFVGIVEGLLARKAPSPKDLQQLLPHVWWRGCRDETVSQERMRASISIITTTMAKVRCLAAQAAHLAAQQILLALLSPLQLWKAADGLEECAALRAAKALMLLQLQAHCRSELPLPSEYKLGAPLQHGCQSCGCTESAIACFRLLLTHCRWSSGSMSCLSC